MSGTVGLVSYRDDQRTVTPFTFAFDDVEAVARAIDTLYADGVTHVTVAVDGEEYLADEWVKYLEGALRSVAPVA